MTQSNRAGFVMLSAILSMAIVGVAIVSLATATSYDGHRTMNAWQRAQTEQLLLAGASDAIVHLNSSRAGAGESWPTPLPVDLAARGAAVRVDVTVNSDTDAELRVVARCLDASMEQVLRFKRDGSTWKLVSAELS